MVDSSARTTVKAYGLRLSCQQVAVKASLTLFTRLFDFRRVSCVPNSTFWRDRTTQFFGCKKRQLRLSITKGKNSQI